MPRAHVELTLTRGRVALIDVDDYTAVGGFKWYADPHENTWYAKRDIRIGGQRVSYYMHRIIVPNAIEVDHIDGNGLDNRRQNLRMATRSQNMSNGRLRKNNRSGYIGVAWHRGAQKWVASVMLDGRSHHVGLFMDPADAAQARDALAVKLHGEYARLNFEDVA